MARRQAIDPGRVQEISDRLIAAAEHGNRALLWEDLLILVPDFGGKTGQDAEIPPDATLTAESDPS